MSTLAPLGSGTGRSPTEADPSPSLQPCFLLTVKLSPAQVDTHSTQPPASPWAGLLLPERAACLRLWKPDPSPVPEFSLEGEGWGSRSQRGTVCQQSQRMEQTLSHHWGQHEGSDVSKSSWNPRPEPKALDPQPRPRPSKASSAP